MIQAMAAGQRLSTVGDSVDRRFLHPRHIMGCITRTGVESSARLGWHRWVVECTLARLGQFRRLTIRQERRADLHQAFLSLDCALRCLRVVEQCRLRLLAPS
jgi:hypothetical protein